MWLKGLGAAQCEFFSTTSSSMCGSWLEAKFAHFSAYIRPKTEGGECGSTLTIWLWVWLETLLRIT